MNGLHPLAQAVAWALIHFLWQGLLLGILMGIVLACLGRRTPQSRYVASCIGLTLMLLSPLITMGVLWPRGAASISPAIAIQGSIQISAFAQAQARMQPWLPTILWAWGLGTLMLAARLMGGLWMVHRLKVEGTSAAPAEWHVVLSRLSRQLGVQRTVRLLRSTKVDVPMVAGWLRPVILLPITAFTQLSPAQLEAVLAHELAHIRRHDFLINLVQAVIETLLFYHPAVWWLSARIREERELCCDDAAVGLCKDALDYARALTLLESHRPAAPSLALSAQGGSLMLRIRRLVQPQLMPLPKWKHLVLSGLALSALGASAYALQEKKEKQVKTFQVIDDGKRLSMKSEGDVKVQPDAKDMVQAGKGGRFRLSEQQNGKSRRYEVDGDKRTYSVDGKEQPLDAEGEAWLRSQLNEMETRQQLAKEAKAHAEESRTHADEARAAAREARRMQVEVKEEGPHVKRIIVKRDGKVESDERVEIPDVVVTEEGPGKKHIIVKRNGKVESDEVVSIPSVRTTREGNRQRVVVEQDGKIIEDQEFELPDAQALQTEIDESFARHPFVADGQRHAQPRGPASQEMERMKAELKSLRKQVEDLQRQLGHTPKPSSTTPAPSKP